MRCSQIHIKGLVQGVGFRPFVYRVALVNNISGSVENRNDGVRILACGKEKEIEAFLNDIRQKAPPASVIQSVKVLPVDMEKLPGLSNRNGFRIIESADVSLDITLVSPDIAVCPECLEDMNVGGSRLDYPFTNCTNCGPRFTIIKELPYDRPNTSMSVFEMCDKCRVEYEDVSDRRFHAQPVACIDCGPKYCLHEKDALIEEPGELLKRLSSLLKAGKVVAIKGLGGYFLACDATDKVAVDSLRKGKKREGKPFAVMFSSIETAGKFAEINREEKQWLESWQRPIVLLRTMGGKALAPGVSMGFTRVGAMLPYMPFHYLLFRESGLEAIVLTSGNFSDEPIVTDDLMALDAFLPVWDAVLSYDREIYNRVDDSVGMVVGKKRRMIRRSRGYAPYPIVTNMNTDGIIATGAELVNTFCVGKGNYVFPSQHIGDLKNLESYEFFGESLERYIKLFRVEPRILACDMHPDYLSTKYARESGLPMVEVQHHHAHIAACMGEFSLDEKVIGVAFDGTGLGDDGNIWGGEFLIADLEDYKRVLHFEYVMMPGGDSVTREPWRMALSYLYHAFGDEAGSIRLPFMEGIEPGEIRIVLSMLKKGLNTPLSSSAGRLFDAVAALIGICSYSTFHAEAPMRLEAALDGSVKETYKTDVLIETGPNGAATISFVKMIKQIVEDIGDGVSAAHISAKFHNTVVGLVIENALRLREDYGINKLVLSGGSFQNSYLLDNIEKGLKEEDFDVFSPLALPANDGGISFGQLLVAARKRQAGI